MHAARTLADLLGGLSGPLAPIYHGCGPTTAAPELCVDSRRVTPGAVFLALRGETHDGHDFVAAALARGAAAVIVEPGRAPAATEPHVIVADTLAAYPTIAAAFHGRPGERLRMAGVTGTNGKTTVTYLVAAMLAAAGRPHARLGTVDNWLVDHTAASGFTTPFPLELQALLAEVVRRGGGDLVMEVSSHALAQGRVRPLRFQAIGMTSFSQDHLDFHGTMAAYLEAKRLLAREHLAAGGVAVAAIDDHPASAIFLADAAAAGGVAWRASRGASADAEIRVLRMVDDDDVGTAAEIATPAGRGLLRSPLVGAFNLDNLLVAVGLGLGLGLDLEVILAALTTCAGAPGRIQRVHAPADRAAAAPEVYVDYAHTPQAVARVLAALRPRCRGRLVIVLGCGGDRDRSKRPVMGELAAAAADRLVATSDNPRTEDPAAIVAEMIAGVRASDRDKVEVVVDRRAAIEAAITGATADDVVVIAGKGHEDYQILGAEKIHFDDAEEARRVLSRAPESP